MNRSHQWPPVVVSFGIAVLGSISQSSVLAGVGWANSLPSLYYIPIVIAAIELGITVAISVALISGISYAVASAFSHDNSWTSAVSETILYVGVGVTAAWLTRLHGNLVRKGHEVDLGGQGLSRGLTDAREFPAQSQIAAGLIHSFRTPVSSIEGAVCLLEDRRLPEEKREEFVRIIQKESHHLDRALSDILDYTQPKKAQWKAVDLSHLVDQVIDRSGLREHGPYFLIRTELAPHMPRLVCDPEQICTMLLNLVMNSIEATPGGGQVVITACQENDIAVITVKDHGRGIAPAIIGRVFDPFFTTRENGLGLGLTVARQIALAHCGNITIVESSDRGSCVAVRLPLDPTNPHEQRPHIGG